MPVIERMDEAIAWHVRLSDPTVPADTWFAFSTWLEADPANAEAYDAVVSADDELADTLSITKTDPKSLQNDNDLVDQPWYRRRGLLAVAASALLTVFAIPALMRDDKLEMVETKLGETHVVAFKDGSRINLNGGTRIEIDRKTGRFAKLVAGEALFTIRHDAAHPFTVEAAGASLIDIGTVFNVRQGEDGLNVTVSEGAVRYEHKSAVITVPAGSRLDIANGGGKPRVSRFDAALVGGWQQGRLAYQDARLDAVAVDIGRAIGTPVTVIGGPADRRFSGVIQLGGDQHALFRRVEVLLGVTARKTDKGWELAP